ncbi:hypothetical protein HO173_006497 [Letharia columbiana]|uniref:Methyltransferase domain-containing protein n=1 Tax=Letharia columbiana TaxID=112416 RepID=A0A8H6FV25_9LECA|nr:uncharacterized protein HO173_006497 [Letharia columbiana]KAF6235302.1 hypothetical protein HO173_006497 [Letharia columbiana]
MTSTAPLPPPLHRLDDQPDNLIASSDVNWLLNGTMDQEDAKMPPQPETNLETTATNGHTIIPPLQPESKPVKDNKAVPWYHTSLAEIDPVTRDLLENYSKIPSDQVKPHVFAIREKAWDVYPYPCIGQFLFLNLTINLSPYYPTLVARLRDPAHTLLDLGCCFAQDVRKLVADGARAENLYGADLHGEFLELGYALFRDRRTLRATFFPADVLDPRDLPLRGLDGEMDVVHLGLFLHHFDFPACVRVCVRVVRLLRPRAGSLVMGVQVGALVADVVPIPIPSGGVLFRHDLASFARLWEEVGRVTGTEWRVEARLERAKGFGEKWQIEGTRRLGFEVWRL